MYKHFFALIPIVLFYFIYFRHFKRSKYFTEAKPNILKQFEALLFGVSAALALIIIGSLYKYTIVKESVVVQSFLYAAFIEKLVAVFAINILLKNYRNFNLTESILTGIIFALGFSGIENYQYGQVYGQSIILIRTIFSVPMHITTCGIIGFYLGINRYHTKTYHKIINLIKMAVITIGAHGSFDYILLSKTDNSIFLPVVMIVSVVILELKLSFSYLIPPKHKLDNEKITYEDFLSVRKQTRNENWIYRSMGKTDVKEIPFFKWENDFVKPFLIIVFLIITLFGVNYKNIFLDIINIVLNDNEQVITFLYFPFSMMITIVIVGIINPEYFKNSLLKIPMIIEVVINPHRDTEETYITYDLNFDNCFIKAIDSVENARTFEVRFVCGKSMSPIISVKKSWENFTNTELPFGNLISPMNIDFRFTKFLFHYYMIRYFFGISFLFKLPGFKKVRKYFVKPQSIMKTKLCVPAGSAIYKEGEHAKSFFLIESGEVGFYKTMWTDVDDKVMFLTKGDIFGETDIVGNNIRTMTAIAETECNLSMADISELKILITTDPDFAYQIILTLSKQIKLLNKNFNQYIQMNKYSGKK